MTLIGEPTLQVVILRVAVVDEHAVGAELAEDVVRALVPVERHHLPASGSTAVANSVEPKTQRLAGADAAIASTPGVFAAAAAAAIGIGEKLFCAVIA